jgi:uncharacterized damage-inducible protein DinB
MAHTLTHHLRYNLWANERIGHLLMAQDDARLSLEQKNSFTSINKTLFHIWDAEVIWLTRLKGGTVQDWPSKTFRGSKTEMLHGFIKNSTELLTFVEKQGLPFQQQYVVYKSMKGDAHESTVEEILFHVVNHGTYHRGQIITLLHGAGATQLVSTDLIVWLREQRKKG